MASHLLGEIERVGQYLVAIDAGHLLRAAELHTFTQQTGTLIVEVDEGQGALSDRLADDGLTTRVDGTHVLVELHGDETNDQVLRAVVDLELALIRVEPRRSSLEDLFRQSHAEEQADEDAAAAAAVAASVGNDPEAEA
jgi:ABC-2 type transport system ATP-binding protein